MKSVPPAMSIRASSDLAYKLSVSFWLSASIVSYPNTIYSTLPIYTKALSRSSWIRAIVYAFHSSLEAETG